MTKELIAQGSPSEHSSAGEYLGKNAGFCPGRAAFCEGEHGILEEKPKPTSDLRPAPLGRRWPWYMAPILMAAVALTVGFARADHLAELGTKVRENPRDGELRSTYAMTLLRAGKLREASREFRVAASLRGNSPEALYDVARVCFAREDYKDARRECSVLAQRHPDDPWAHVCNARTFLIKHRVSKAMDELEPVLKTHPEHYESLLALADAFRLEVDLPNAEKAYTEASKANTKAPEPLVGLGRLHATAHRTDQAIQAFRRALALAPESAEIQYELGSRLTSEEGLELLRKAALARPGWGEAQVALGEALLAHGDTESAIKAFQSAVRANPALAQAHLGLGRALQAKGNLERAQASFEQALKLVPNDRDALLALADLHAAKGQSDDAFELYRMAADADPAQPDSLIRAARLALSLKREALAAGFLDRLIASHPHLGEAWALYGDIMMRRGNYDRAKVHYERALSAEGNFDRERIRQTLRKLSKR